MYRHSSEPSFFDTMYYAYALNTVSLAFFKFFNTILPLLIFLLFFSYVYF